MNGKSLISPLFALAALYDGLVGLVFLLIPGPLFQWAGVPPPNHFAYVRFPGALLVIFAAMFAAIAREPERSRSLIPYGIALKVSYCAICFYYWFRQGVPNIWKPFAIADLVCILLFAWAYTSLGTPKEPTSTTGAAPTPAS